MTQIDQVRRGLHAHDYTREDLATSEARERVRDAILDDLDLRTSRVGKILYRLARGERVWRVDPQGREGEGVESSDSGAPDTTDRYRLDDRVRVREHGGSRAYVEIGQSLVMLEHGDGPKDGDLAALMAGEAREAWGRTRHRYALRGHWHHERTRDVGGVQILQVPSLAPADAWHRHKGYTLASRAHVAYLLDEQEGLIGRSRVALD